MALSIWVIDTVLRKKKKCQQKPASRDVINVAAIDFCPPEVDFVEILI